MLVSMSIVLGVIPVFVLWFVIARPGIGPIVLGVKRGQGIHLGDLVVMVIAVLIWVKLAGRLSQLWNHHGRRRGIWFGLDS